MSILKIGELTVIGRILLLVGIVLTTAKWIFDIEEIGSWTLLFLLPGVLLTFLGDRRKRAENDR